MSATAETLAAAAAAAAAAATAALLRGVSGAADDENDDAVARALADVQARCHVEDDSAPEGTAFVNCLAHARALMDAGVPDALAQLLVGTTSNAFSRRCSAQVLSALRALFAPAARLRGREPDVAEQAGAALGAFAVRGGIAAAAALLSHDDVSGATAAADVLQILLYAAQNAAPAVALAPLCTANALTQLLSLAGGTATPVVANKNYEYWRSVFAPLLLLITLLTHSSRGADVAARLVAPDEVLSGGAVPLLLAIALCPHDCVANAAADALRWLLVRLEDDARRACAATLTDAALPPLVQRLYKRRGSNSIGILLCAMIRFFVPIADAELVPIPAAMLRHVPALRTMCAAGAADNRAVLHVLAGLAATMPGACCARLRRRARWLPCIYCCLQSMQSRWRARSRCHSRRWTRRSARMRHSASLRRRQRQRHRRMLPSLPHRCCAAQAHGARSDDAAARAPGGGARRRDGSLHRAARVPRRCRARHAAPGGHLWLLLHSG
jgi:hypothetical protein